MNIICFLFQLGKSRIPKFLKCTILSIAKIMDMSNNFKECQPKLLTFKLPLK